MRVLVCGGRDFGDPDSVRRVLDELKPTSLIEGGALGADCFAAEWAADNPHIEHLQFNADWEIHGKFAGRLRNLRMIIEGRPDIVVAFPGGKGTADMIRQAFDFGIEVRREK